PIALLAFAALAHARRRAVASGTLAALGIGAKLFPAAFGPPAFGALLARRPARAMAFAAAAVAVLLALNLPVALRAPENWGWFFVFNAARGAENSVWHALGVPSGPLLGLVSTGPLLVATLLATAAAFLVARRGGDAVRATLLGTALVLVVWIATNKVWSPQYALYGFLAGALVAAPWRFFWLASALAVADYHAAFEVRARRWEVAFRDLVFHPLAILRTLVWLLLAAWLARELWRLLRSAQGAGGPASSPSFSDASSM
ncbi:MAG TPA: glycosyltransferase 87 family protein, partial [Anaeromyxobacteraceae bacterium]|nr:glycosyltransferase 87 family protein [Anaeromyxobacteraceae bacterium]